MKRLVLTLASILLLLTVGFTQDSTRNFFASISIGPAFPIGRFSKDEFTLNPAKNEPAGAARVGFAAKGSIGYHITPRLSLLLQLAYGQHKQSGKGLNKLLLDSNVAATSAATRMESWKTASVMLGIQWRGKISGLTNCYPYFNLSGGINKSEQPGYEYTVYSNGNAFLWGKTASKSLPIGFCYQVEAGLEQVLKANWFLQYRLSWYNGFSSQRYAYVDNFPNGNLINSKFKYTIAALQLGVGLGYRF